MGGAPAAAVSARGIAEHRRDLPRIWSCRAAGEIPIMIRPRLPPVILPHGRPSLGPNAGEAAGRVGGS